MDKIQDIQVPADVVELDETDLDVVAGGYELGSGRRNPKA